MNGNRQSVWQYLAEQKMYISFAPATLLLRVYKIDIQQVFSNRKQSKCLGLATLNIVPPFVKYLGHC